MNFPFMWFHLFIILEMTEFRDAKQINDFQGLGMAEGSAYNY